MLLELQNEAYETTKKKSLMIIALEELNNDQTMRLSLLFAFLNSKTPDCESESVNLKGNICLLRNAQGRVDQSKMLRSHSCVA